MIRSEYVIVGANVAAVGAIDGIRRHDKKSSILTISYESLGSYSKAMLAEYIEGANAQWLEYRGKDYFKKMGVDCLFGRRVTGLDAEKSVLTTDNGKEIVFTFTDLFDAEKIREALPRFNSAVVIGAGFTGTEIAYTLNKLNKKVTVVELGDRVLVKALDPRSSEIAQSLMQGEGIEFYLNDTVEEIAGNKEITGVSLKNGKFIPCQAVITAIGVIPNGELIKNTPIKFDRGLDVDDYMCTNVPNVYGAGDVVKALDITDGQKRSLPLWPLAFQQGLIAGKNMAGFRYPYAGGLPMNSLKFLKVPILSAGITTPPDASYEVISVSDPKSTFYRSLVLKEGRLKGFVTIGEIDGAGVLTGLIRSKTDISAIKTRLLNKKKIGLMQMPREWRNRIFTRRDETGYHD